MNAVVRMLLIIDADSAVVDQVMIFNNNKLHIVKSKL
jgi:hypothetical protein